MPQLSLVGGVARSLDLCVTMLKSIKTNLDIEIIFLGPVNFFAKGKNPNPPLEEFGCPPLSYKFITTPVKLVQCWEIGMRCAQGETVGLLNDDQKFTPYAWDEAYSIYKESNDYKTIVSLNWWELATAKRREKCKDAGIILEEVEKDGSNGINLYHNLRPLTQCCGVQLPTGSSVMSRQFFVELGGYDANFIKRQAPEDVFVRAITNGATIKYCKEGGIFEDIRLPQPKFAPWARTSKGSKGVDQMLRVSKWELVDGLFKQKIDTKHFIFDDTIYHINQGNF